MQNPIPEPIRPGSGQRPGARQDPRLNWWRDAREGVIPEPSVDRLLAMGRWLEVNGEAIYGTRPGPLQGLEWCRTTAKPGKVYLHVFDWPRDGALRLPRQIGPVQAATRLAAGQSDRLAVTTTDDSIILKGPTEAPDPIATVVALAIES